jgi:hypothetical protein
MQQTRRDQGVVPRDALFPGAGRGERDEACRYPAADVLRDLVPKIAVQRLRAAVKVRTVVRGGERYDPEGLTAHSAVKSLGRRTKAPFRAGVGSGGDKSACATHS